ncbi:hypothetical protein D3C84_1104120 [compost metagenome]
MPGKHHGHAGLLQDAFGAFPSLVFGVRQNGAQRQTEANATTVFGGLGAHLLHHVAHLFVGFAPQRIHVRMLARHFDGRRR